MEKFKQKKKILIIGGSSLLGLNWAVNSQKIYKFFLAYNKTKVKVKNTKSIYLNFNDIKNTEKKIIEINPDFIINLAAITDVELCETNKKIAYEVNAKLPLILSKITNRLDCKLLHISTDQLFSNKRGNFSENSKVSPLNYYGKSKYLGERQIVKYCKNYLIIRTNFFGYGTKYKISYSEYILDIISKKNQISLNENIYFNPIYICNLINICDYLLKNNIKGLFNISADDSMSKYKFGITLCKLLKIKKYYNKIYIERKLSTTKRPTHMSLNNNKINKIYNLKIGTISQNIKMMIKDKNHLIRLQKNII